jgi:hypothetical protein
MKKNKVREGAFGFGKRTDSAAKKGQATYKREREREVNLLTPNSKAFGWVLVPRCVESKKVQSKKKKTSTHGTVTIQTSSARPLREPMCM